MLSPSLRRLSVSSVVSTGFLCPSVVSPVSPAPSVVRAPLAFFPAGYGRLLRRPALGGSGDSFSLRRLRSLRSSSAPPSALRSFLRSSVPPPFLRSQGFVSAPSSLRLFGRLYGLPLSLRRLSGLSGSFGRPSPPRLFPCGLRPPVAAACPRGLGGLVLPTSPPFPPFLLRSAVCPPFLPPFLRSSSASSYALAAASGGGTPPPPTAGSGGGTPPPPPALTPSLRSPAASP